MPKSYPELRQTMQTFELTPAPTSRRINSRREKVEMKVEVLAVIEPRVLGKIYRESGVDPRFIAADFRLTRYDFSINHIYHYRVFPDIY